MKKFFFHTCFFLAMTLFTLPAKAMAPCETPGGCSLSPLAYIIGGTLIGGSSLAVSTFAVPGIAALLHDEPRPSYWSTLGWSSLGALTGYAGVMLVGLQMNDGQEGTFLVGTLLAPLVGASIAAMIHHSFSSSSEKIAASPSQLIPQITVQATEDFKAVYLRWDT